MKPKILVSITSIDGRWKQKIKEATKLNIKEAALFLTALTLRDRKQLYLLLNNSSIKSIPHVHLRSDNEPWELDYLIKNYKTKVFNLHSQTEYPLTNDLTKYYKQIYLENLRRPLDDAELKQFGGLCLDFSHWERTTLEKMPVATDLLTKVKKYKIGCAHISAIRKNLLGHYRDRHYLKNLKEIDYIKKYVKYLPAYCSIELENSIARQLEIKKRIEKIIGL